MGVLKQLLGFEEAGVGLMVPIVGALHAVSYKLHELFLVDFSRDVLVPKLAALTGLADPAKLSWACVLFGYLLVFLTFETSLVYSSSAEPKGYNVFAPRTMATRATGLGARLFGAHLNATEDLAPFGLAVACAGLLQADAHVTAQLAALHAVYRVVHWAGYAANVVAARSLAFVMGQQTTVFIFLAALYGAAF